MLSLYSCFLLFSALDVNPDHSLPERAVRWRFNNLDTNRNKVNTLLFSAEFHYALNPVRVLPSFHSVTSLSTIICITILLIQTSVILFVSFNRICASHNAATSKVRKLFTALL